MCESERGSSRETAKLTAGSHGSGVSVKSVVPDAAKKRSVVL